MPSLNFETRQINKNRAYIELKRTKASSATMRISLYMLTLAMVSNTEDVNDVPAAKVNTIAAKIPRIVT